MEIIRIYQNRKGNMMMEIDKNVENMIRDQIETLKRTNAKMRQQAEQEINKNTWLIYALEKLLNEH